MTLTKMKTPPKHGIVPAGPSVRKESVPEYYSTPTAHPPVVMDEADLRMTPDEIQEDTLAGLQEMATEFAADPNKLLQEADDIVAAHQLRNGWHDDEGGWHPPPAVLYGPDLSESMEPGPLWVPCAEDGCDTPTRSAICDKHHAEFLTTLSPSARAFLTGQPAPAAPFTASQLDEAYYRGRVDAATQMLKVRPTPRPPKLSWEDRAAENRGELGYDEHGNWGPLPKAAAPEPVDSAAAFWDACIVVEDDDSEGDFPALIETTDGRMLISTQRSSSIIGHGGSGKSWLLLDIIQNAIDKGGRVVYADFEETKRTLLKRARMMDMEECVINIGRMRYVVNSFFDPENAAGRTGAKQWLLNVDDPDPKVDPTYSVLIIDTMESASCPSDGANIGPWWASHVEDWLPTKEGLPGVAVVMADHPPKRKDESVEVEAGIGSTHKTTKLTGAGLLLTGGVTWTPKADGNKNMKVAKDRHGITETPQGKIAAKVFGRVRVMPDGKSVLQFSYEPSDAETDAAEGDNVEDRIIAAINEAGPQGIRTSKNVYELAGVNWKKAGDALKRLENRGYIHASKDGRANIYAITPEGKQHLLTGGDSGTPEHNGELF